MKTKGKIISKPATTKRWLVLSGMIFLLILVPSLFFRPARLLPTSQIPNIEIILSNNRETVPTDGWKKYTNIRYGFSFLYPNSWEIASNDNTEEEIKNSKSIRITSLTLTTPKLSGTFSITTNPSDKNGYPVECGNLDECVASATKYFTDGYVAKDLTFLGRPAKRYIKENKDLDQIFDSIFVKIDNNFYGINMTAETDEFLDDLPIFNTMLSSFTLEK